MRAFTPATPPSPAYARKRVLSREPLTVALALALVGSAVVVPLPPMLAVALALTGAIALCCVASLLLQRAVLVMMTMVVLLVAGAFDRERAFSVHRAPAPEGARVAWLITVDDALRLFVEPLPLRALFGSTYGAHGSLHRDVADARVVWSRDGQSFLVVGHPRSKGLWAASELAWSDERILGRWTTSTPWRWEPIEPWSTRAPDWFAWLDGDAWAEVMVTESSLSALSRVLDASLRPPAP